MMKVGTEWRGVLVPMGSDEDPFGCFLVFQVAHE
jgi:hypothetical protein